MNGDPRDYKLDLSSAARAGQDKPSDSSPSPSSQLLGSAGASGRPFLSVHFACCGVYQRIYRSPDGAHYAGHCPRCLKAVRFVVGQGGTAARSFTVT